MAPSPGIRPFVMADASSLPSTRRGKNTDLVLKNYTQMKNTGASLEEFVVGDVIRTQIRTIRAPVRYDYCIP